MLVIFLSHANTQTMDLVIFLLLLLLVICCNRHQVQYKLVYSDTLRIILISLFYEKVSDVHIRVPSLHVTLTWYHSVVIERDDCNHIFTLPWPVNVVLASILGLKMHNNIKASTVTKS